MCSNRYSLKIYFAEQSMSTNVNRSLISKEFCYASYIVSLFIQIFEEAEQRINTT